MSADLLARGVAARAVAAGARLDGLRRLSDAMRPVSMNPPELSIHAEPPVITETDGTATTIASAAVWPGSGDWARWTGLPMVAGTGGLASYRVSSNSISNWVVLEWMSDASLLELRLANYNSRFDIKVDGRPLRATVFTTATSGPSRYVKLDWSGTAEPARVRLYRIEGFNLPIAALYTNGSASAWAPEDRAARPLIAWMGDSYVQGTGAGTGREHVAPLASAMLGADHWHDGVGGTGWNTAGGNEPALRLTARMATMSRPPDIVVSALGYNDGGGDLGGVDSRYRAWVAAVRGAMPTARIVTLGPWTPLGNTTNLENVRATLRNAASASGASFVDIADWINTANRDTLTGADNVHPTRAGHVFLARRAAQSIAALLGRG